MSQISQHKNAVSGIILAAGMGSRMKTAKQLLSYSGKPLLQHVVDSARSSNLSKIITVLGYQAEKVKNQLDLKGVESLRNQFYDTGQGSSIRVGLTVVPDHHQAVLFLLGDQPLISSQIINSILDHFQTTQSPIVIPRFHGKRGNPVLIARPLFAELYKLSGDMGGRKLFENHAEDIGYLDLDDEGIITDIDTPSDYDRLVKGDNPQ